MEGAGARKPDVRHAKLNRTRTRAREGFIDFLRDSKGVVELLL